MCPFKDDNAKISWQNVLAWTQYLCWARKEKIEYSVTNFGRAERYTYMHIKNYVIPSSILKVPAIFVFHDNVASEHINSKLGRNMHAKLLHPPASPSREQSLLPEPIKMV